MNDSRNITTCRTVLANLLISDKMELVFASEACCGPGNEASSCGKWIRFWLNHPPKCEELNQA